MELNEEQLLAEQFRALQDEGSEPKKIKIGDTEVDANDLDAVQNAINARFEATAREIDALKAGLTRPQVTPPPLPVEPRPEPRKSRNSKMDLDQYAELLKTSPISAHDEALATAWGLPEGVGTKQIIEALSNRLVGLEQTLSQSQAAAQGEALQREAERFRDAHPEYETTNENFETLHRYLQENELKPNARGWEMAYKAAVHDGAIVPKGGEREEVVVPVPAKRRGMPSLRNTGASDNQFDLGEITAQLDKLPQDEAFARINAMLRKTKG